MPCIKFNDICISQLRFNLLVTPTVSKKLQTKSGAEIQGGQGVPRHPQNFLRELGTSKINAPCVKLNARSGKWVSILLSSLAESHAFSYAAGEARSGLRRHGPRGLSCFFGTPKI